MQRQAYPSLTCNHKNSSKANCKLAAMVYKNDIRIYGLPQSYSLSKNHDGYVLVPNHISASQQHKKLVDPKDMLYSYVIVQDEVGNPQLKLANGSHYYLANKADSVIAAGEIHFNNNRIDKINDKSGTYPSHILAMSPEMREDYLESIRNIFMDLDLPFDKYEFHKPKEIKVVTKSDKQSSYWSGFFTREILVGAATTCAIAVGIYSFS